MQLNLEAKCALNKFQSGHCRLFRQRCGEICWNRGLGDTLCHALFVDHHQPQGSDKVTIVQWESPTVQSNPIATFIPFDFYSTIACPCSTPYPLFTHTSRVGTKLLASTPIQRGFLCRIPLSPSSQSTQLVESSTHTTDYSHGRRQVRSPASIQTQSCH